jgi:hypothetical protein
VEVLVDTEPVVATPILAFAVPEHAVEPIVKEEILTTGSVEDVTLDVVGEDKLAVDEPEVSAPEPQEKVEGLAPVVAAPVEESSPEVIGQEVPAPAVSEPTVEPAAEEEPTASVLKPEVPTPEPQEPKVVPPPVSSEKKLSTDEPAPEEASPAISEPVDAAENVSTPDVPQEETKQVERPWTPSYSVSSQGGGLDTAPPADEEVDEPPTPPEPPVEEPAAEPTPTPEIVTPAEVRTFNISFPSQKIDQLFV